MRVSFPRGIQFLLRGRGGRAAKPPAYIRSMTQNSNFDGYRPRPPRHRAARACGRCKDAGVDAYPRLLERRRRRTTLFFDKTRVTYEIVRIQVPPTCGGCKSFIMYQTLHLYRLVTVTPARGGLHYGGGDHRRAPGLRARAARANPKQRIVIPI